MGLCNEDWWPRQKNITIVTNHEFNESKKSGNILQMIGGGSGASANLIFLFSKPSPSMMSTLNEKSIPWIGFLTQLPRNIKKFAEKSAPLPVTKATPSIDIDAMFPQPTHIAIPSDPSFELSGVHGYDGGSGAMGGGVGGALAFQPQGQESDASNLVCHTITLDLEFGTIPDSDDLFGDSSLDPNNLFDSL